MNSALLMLAGGLLFVWLSKYLSAGSRRKNFQQEYAKWLNDLRQQGRGLPRLSQASIALRGQECAYWEEPVVRVEQSSTRTYFGGGPTFRLAKGIAFRTGMGRSYSTPQERDSDRGMLTITDRRIVFAGNVGNAVFPLDKILTMRVEDDALRINSSTHRKALIVRCANPLITQKVLESVMKH